MYPHYRDEQLFDYILIKESDEFVDGYRTAVLYGVNYFDENGLNAEDQLHPICRIDCFRTSPSCMFDFHENGGITVFSKDFSCKNRKVFARNSFTGEIIAYIDSYEQTL